MIWDAMRSALSSVTTEYAIEGNYGGGTGWETLTHCETLAEAEQELATYNENEPQTPHRIKRVK